MKAATKMNEAWRRTLFAMVIAIFSNRISNIPFGSSPLNATRNLKYSMVELRDCEN